VFGAHFQITKAYMALTLFIVGRESWEL